MLRLRVRWNRLFGVYMALAAACLVVGAFATSSLHDILLGIGVGLVAGFVPLVMGIYFVRGLLRIQ
jgi:hypothetical protein